MITQVHINELLSEIANLREEKQTLQEEHELRNNIELTNMFHHRIGEYGDLTKLPDYHDKWWNSFYVRHRLYAEQRVNFTLKPSRITRFKKDMAANPYCDKLDYKSISCICYYDTFFYNRKVSLVLNDPYGTLRTSPTDLITLDQANASIQRMFYVEIGVLEGSDEYPIRVLEPLPYKLYMDI